MNANRLSLREEYGRATSAWDVKSEPIFRAWIDKQKQSCLGFPFFSVLTCFLDVSTSTLSLQFPLGAILITGPKVQEFFDGFCANRATCVFADGVDILSVSFVKAGLEPSDEETQAATATESVPQD